MRGFRINWIVITVVGVVACLGAAAGMYFGLIVPTQTQINTEEARYQAIAMYSDKSGIAVAQKQLVAAQAAANAVAEQWAYIVRYKNPKVDVSDRFHAWLQWTNELEFDFAPRVEAFLNHTGVQSLTKISAPPPPSDPNAVPTAMIAMPLGAISVFGSYNQILNHVARWNRFDRIVLVDGLSLTGYSPFVTGTYTATEYIFPQNGDKPGPPVPSGSAPVAAGAPTGTAANIQNQPGFGSKSPTR